MMQVLKSKQVDASKWDTCILQSANGNLYGLYDSIQTACTDWMAFVQDDYAAVAALPIKRKLGLTYSWHPQFLGPLGIFSAQPNQIRIEEFISEIKKHSWWVKMFYWQNLQPDFKAVPWNYQLLEFGNQSMDEIRSHYNENTRRNIQKAVKLGLEVREINSVDLLVNSFRKEKGEHIENLNEDSYQLLHRLISHWAGKGLATMKAIYQNEELLAIGCFLHWRNMVIYYKGVVTSAGKNTGAMHYLIDQEIQLAAKPGNIFDFGGSNTESVARFYKAFGGSNHAFYLNEFKKFKI